MKFTNFTLKTPDDSTFNLYKYTPNNYVLLLFFRGAWCTFCKKQLQELGQNIDFFDQKNIKLVAISNDSQLKSNLLKTFLKLPFPVLSDPNTQLISKLNLKTKYKGHTTAKPAMFLLDKNHTVLYRYVSDNYDDRVSFKDLTVQINEAIKL